MPQPASLLPSLCAQLMAAPSRLEPPKPDWPVNPFPKGIRPGSATDKIMKTLTDNHPRWIEHWELRNACGLSRGAVSWAVSYLTEHGLVRSIKSSRNPQYKRFQAVIVKE